MKLSILVSTLSLVLGSFSSASAQTVSVAGRLVVPLDTSCLPASGGFWLEQTDVYLTSTTIPLAQSLGQDVFVTGTLTPASCSLVDVTVLVPAPYVLETCGGGALGCGARIVLHSAGGGTFGLFIGLNDGFVPSGVAGGTLLVDPATSILALIAPESGTKTTIDVLIPQDPALFALTFKLQGVRQSPLQPGLLQWSTLDSIFAGTFTTPCSLPQC